MGHERVRLRRVTEFNPSKSEVRSLPADTPVLFLPMEAVSERGAISLKRWRPLGEVYQGYTYFRSGDVLVAKITPCFENGKGGVVPTVPSGVGFGTTEFHVLRPSAEVSPRYLFYITSSSDFRGLGTGAMIGAAGQKRVPEEFVKEYQIALPARARQDAIVDFLDRKTAAIDALIAEKEKLLDRLAEKRAALINRAVTRGLDTAVPLKDSGIRWLGQIPNHWALLQLRRVVREFIDYRGRTPRKSEEGIPLITAGAVRDGRIVHERAPEWVSPEVHVQLSGRGRPQVGDLLFTSEAPLGEVGLVEDPKIACAQRIILFRVERSRMLPEYLRLYYLSESGRSEIRSRASGSTAEGIRADRLRMSAVLVPPLPEQEAIVSFVRSATEGDAPLEDEARRQLLRLEEYRQSLITAAVTGQLAIP